MREVTSRAVIKQQNRSSIKNQLHNVSLTTETRSQLRDEPDRDSSRLPLRATSGAAPFGPTAMPPAALSSTVLLRDVRTLARLTPSISP